MTGKLYGVGVGPGDPELITLKALRLTKEADILAFPGEKPIESVAYRIMKGAYPEIEQQTDDFPANAHDQRQRRTETSS